MVTTRQLTGSKQQIADQIHQLNGRVLSAVILIEETPDAMPPVDLSNDEFMRILDDMKDDVVHVPHADDSREAIYTRMGDE